MKIPYTEKSLVEAGREQKCNGGAFRQEGHRVDPTTATQEGWSTQVMVKCVKCQQTVIVMSYELEPNW